MSSETDNPYPHLPPGHPPGPQSRRYRTSLRILAPAMGCGGLLFLFMVPIAIAVGEAALIFGMLFGSIVFFGAAVALTAKQRARGAEHLTVEPSLLELRRGAKLSVTLRVRDGGDSDARIEVGLVCVERWDHWSRSQRAGDSRTRTTSEDVAWQEWVPATRSAVQTFQFTVPPGGPFSWEGSALSYAWRVSARELKPLGFDPSTDVPVWVAP